MSQGRRAHVADTTDTSGLGGPVNREYIEYMFEQMATVRGRGQPRVHPSRRPV